MLQTIRMAYLLLTGRLQDSCDLVIRNYEKTGREHIYLFPRITLESMHVVRAGLTAHKLLQEEGRDVSTISLTKNPPVRNPRTLKLV